MADSNKIFRLKTLSKKDLEIIEAFESDDDLVFDEDDEADIRLTKEYQIYQSQKKKLDDTG